MNETNKQANHLSILGELDFQTPETELHFADGRIFTVPTALLRQTEALEETQDPLGGESQQVLIPIIEERLEVGKRLVDTGKVHLHKSVETYDVKLDEPLAVEEWSIERVAKHEVVTEAPIVRQEGETTVYPVVEERLLLTKELILVEEIRVNRMTTERRDTQTVVLRREKMNVERIELKAL